MASALRFIPLCCIVLYSVVVSCSTSTSDLETDWSPFGLESGTPDFSGPETIDIPVNEGVRNALLNADQLVDIQYSVSAPMAGINDSYYPQSTVKGMIYSSARHEDLFCPNNVSFWTFFSALSDPNSYLYTIDIAKPPYSLKGYAKNFYGQVCTSFVQYALGIKYNFQIHQMTVWDGFEKLERQWVNDLQLGDVLITEAGHTRLVTGIRRRGGNVYSVTVSEGTVPRTKKAEYSYSEIREWLRDHQYVIYRYKYISETRHTPSPFVQVGDEPESAWPKFNSNLMPKRGDRANWRKDEPVIVDVLDAAGYTEYRLYKDGDLILTEPLPPASSIDLGVLPYGSYKMSLANDSDESMPVCWIVADYSVSVEAIGNGRVKAHFNSMNAKPLWLTWRTPLQYYSDNNNMPLWTEVIRPEDVAAGFLISEPDSYTKRHPSISTWDFKVAFETEYGIISSDSVSVDIF